MRNNAVGTIDLARTFVANTVMSYCLVQLQRLRLFNYIFVFSNWEVILTGKGIVQ